MFNRPLVKQTLFWVLFISLCGLGFIGLWATMSRLSIRVIPLLPSEMRTYWMPAVPTALPAPAFVATFSPVTLVPLPTDPLPTLVPTYTPQSVSAMATMAPAVAETASPISTPTPLPTQQFVSGVTVIPQTFNNCSPANLTMLLNFYGQNLTQETVATALKPNANDRNVSPEEMATYVQQNSGLGAAVFYGGDLDFLRRFLAAGFPVIIEQGYDPEDDEWMGHYLTLVGYDDVAQAFWVMDSLLGPWDSSGKRESYTTVEPYWYHFNNVAIVVYPLEQEQKVMESAGTALSSPLTMWQQSAQSAQSRTQTIPSDPFAWFNLGKSLTHLYQLTHQPDYNLAAVAAFDQARTIGLPYRLLWYQFEPYQAYLAANRYQDVHILVNATFSTSGGQNVEETYLYQGYAFEQQGERAAAKAAYTTALTLNPHFVAAQIALSQISD